MEYANLQKLGEAMVKLSPVRAYLHGLPRLFCPHALGVKKTSPHIRRAFVWQFGGESEHADDLPNWRCFAVRELEDLELAGGLWRKGKILAHGIQECIDLVEAAVASEFTSAKFTHEQLRP